MSSSTLPAQRIVFTAKQQVSLESFEAGAPAQGELLIRTELSLMSTGTENIVFNRLFDPGTHFDKWVRYPFYPGYASVGTVLAVGADVSGFAAGDRVAFRVGHRSHAIAVAANCTKIPADLPFESAVWFPLAKIAFHGAKAARYRLGDSVLIIGAGPIGQMSTRWAAAAGAGAIVVVDAMESRLAFAKAGGATAVISAGIERAREQILEASGGRLPRVVIDSTGNAAVFAAALGLAADFGTVVVLGDTGTPARQSLTPDVITRGLTIVGAHDAHNTAEWNERTITELFFSLVTRGRFSVEGLNSHTFRPEACEDAYAVANRDRAHTMGILFDWSGAGR
ncbi:MAG: zinc-binding dehydrogenase [Chthoniobacteraceae bacterium]|nr:zinc-binding dehydrogenase [Chthoniobacteraceae bacterium]